MHNTVEEFKGKMALEMESILPAIKRNDGKTQKFTLALPIGASCHEYEQYVPEGQRLRRGLRAQDEQRHYGGLCPRVV